MREKHYSKELMYGFYITQRLTIRACAKKLKCETRTVMNYLEKHGIQTRTVSEATKGRDVWNKGKCGLQVAWNKGTVGICKPNSGTFQKGQHTKEKHPMWKGGITKLNKHIRGNSSEENRTWREGVFARDNHTCQLCTDDGYIEAHHIKPFAKILEEYQLKTKEEALRCNELWDIENGITFCKKCHRIAHSTEGRKQLML